MFLYEGRAFLSVPGEGDGELFVRPGGTFTVRVVEGVTIRFDEEAWGRCADSSSRSAATR